MRQTIRIILGTMLLVLASSQAMADHRDGWNSGRDGWDTGSSEGQSCYLGGGGYGSCSYGLVCYSDGRYGNDQGQCKRMCSSNYDCHAGQYCRSNGRRGVCMYDGEGGGNGGGYNPPRPGREAYEGQYCSIYGNGYPVCARNLVCSNTNYDGVGICRSQWRR